MLSEKHQADSGKIQVVGGTEWCRCLQTSSDKRFGAFCWTWGKLRMEWI